MIAFLFMALRGYYITSNKL